ncbi:MAG: 3-dehydroquinate synthase [Ferruginibacter sp.]
MKRITNIFSHRKTDYLFGGSFERLGEEFDHNNIFIITDENVNRHHARRFEGYKKIILPPGEPSKTQQTVDLVIAELLKAEADKNCILVGVGGGVITDMTGYAASVFKRGTRLALVPTSLLAMVDAAIGGKNGVNVGACKNMVGTVYQPEVILFDYNFLESLPEEEWINGFAEIIKHACIKDASMFEMLEKNSPETFVNDRGKLAALVEQNVSIKTDVVLQDEFETGERKLLNFGHTIGHAIENMYQLPHGHAVSIGMMAACSFSEEINLFSSDEKLRVQNLLARYQLPVNLQFDKMKAWEQLVMDKKRDNNAINFILLDKIGTGKVVPVSLVQLKDMIDAL